MDLPALRPVASDASGVFALQNDLNFVSAETTEMPPDLGLSVGDVLWISPSEYTLADRPGGFAYRVIEILNWTPGRVPIIGTRGEVLGPDADVVGTVWIPVPADQPRHSSTGVPGEDVQQREGNVSLTFHLRFASCSPGSVRRHPVSSAPSRFGEHLRRGRVA